MYLLFQLNFHKQIIFFKIKYLSNLYFDILFFAGIIISFDIIKIGRKISECIFNEIKLDSSYLFLIKYVKKLLMRKQKSFQKLLKHILQKI